MAEPLPPADAPGGVTFSASEYFATQPAPPNLDEVISGVRAFVQRQKEMGRRVVLVTSGGTTVPLEMNVVRFLDNFSAGTRGATSAEYFLSPPFASSSDSFGSSSSDEPYSVIFMHRQHSLQPFSRHYSHSTNPFLDLLSLRPSPTSSSTSPRPDSAPSAPEICVEPSKAQALLPVLQAHHAAAEQDRLHTISFVTVSDYLFLLRAVAREMRVLGRNGMYYLAAAVSDFFIPRQRMSEHKIQSQKGSLLIEMDQVPKVLSSLVEEWTPEGFIISFKLETDQNLLIPKARAALERYGHHLVIGNDLHKRKREVVFVERRSLSPSPSASKEEFRETWVCLTEEDLKEGREIEERIVRELRERHGRWIEGGGGREGGR